MARDRLSAAQRLAAGLVAAGISGLLSLGLAWAWPDEPGVLLTAAERQAVLVELGLQGFVGGAFLGLVLGRHRASAGVAALVAPLLLVLLALAPRSGSISIEVEESVIYGVGALGAALALLALGRFRRLALGAAALLLVGGVAVGLSRDGGGARDEPGTHPDILLLTLDTVRADHFDFHSGDVPKAHTPHLSALAARGRVYDAAFAPMAITGPSHVTMFSGLSPREHGVRRNGAELDGSLPWLPEELDRAGYHTRAVVSAAVLEGSLGFWRGFDAYDSQFAELGEGGDAEDRRARLVRGHGLLSWQGWRRRAGSAFHRAGADTLAVLDDAPAREAPTFTWVHLYDAHWPYTPSPEAARRAGLDDHEPLSGGLLPVFLLQGQGGISPEDLARGQALYRAGLDDVDALVGRLLEGVGEDTLVVVVADHGESLGEHDYTFNHGMLPYAPDTRVPLILAGPGVEPGRVESPVAVADLGRTVLELAGLAVPEGMGGRSLLEPDPERIVVSASWAKEFPGAVSEGEELGPWAGVAVRQGRGTAAVTRWQAASLYDRDRDPRELAPLGDDEAEDLAPLRAAMRLELDQPVAGAAEVEEGMEAALQALGYLEAEGPAEPEPEPAAAGGAAETTEAPR